MRISPRSISFTLGVALIPWTMSLAQPVCDAGGPYQEWIGQAITFDGTGSSAPGGTIVSYQWDFGDGTTGTGPTPQHSYGSLGTFTVTLIVTDDDNASSACETAALVFGEIGIPTCDAGGPYTGTVGEPVQFDGTGSSDPGGFITDYSWWFADGTVGIGPTPQHTYTESGTFEVALTVTEDEGASSTCTTVARIGPTLVEPATWGRIKHLYETH